ncbi:MAG TPA: hypothetical protein VMH88_07570 [Gemmatimonadales bacterium]|nr:hypothetical protein [Gemmatimonadales bacterium]
MAPPSILRTGGIVVAISIAAACSSSWYGSVSNDWDARGRGAYDLPIRFVTDTTVFPAGSSGCPVTWFDPRDHHALRLTQSGRDDTGGYRGDYLVTPTGRYGVRAGELLRVDCANGRAVGIVPEPKT